MDGIYQGKNVSSPCITAPWRQQSDRNKEYLFNLQNSSSQFTNHMLVTKNWGDAVDRTVLVIFFFQYRQYL